MKQFAVISHPRTGSRSLANKISKSKKIPIAPLHCSTRLDLECISFDIFKNTNCVVHSHWHTLPLLNTLYTEHLFKFYQIFEIDRHPIHSMLSTLIVMQIKDINFSERDIPTYLCNDLVYEYVSKIAKGNRFKKYFKNLVTLDFDVLYKNTSYLNFERNKKKIKNFNKILETYNKLISENDR